MSVAANLVLLGGLCYIASIDYHVKTIRTTLNSPVVIYSPKAIASTGSATSAKSPATPQ
jgi:hypothetical protein